MSLEKTIQGLVDESMEVDAERIAREKKEGAMPKTDTITRRVNVKDIKTIKVSGRVYPVTAWTHSQDGVEVEYEMRNGKSKSKFVPVGKFDTIRHGYPNKISSDEEE